MSDSNDLRRLAEDDQAEESENEGSYVDSSEEDIEDTIEAEERALQKDDQELDDLAEDADL